MTVSASRLVIFTSSSLLLNFVFPFQTNVLGSVFGFHSPLPSHLAAVPELLQLVGWGGS